MHTVHLEPLPKKIGPSSKVPVAVNSSDPPRHMSCIVNKALKTLADTIEYRQHERLGTNSSDRVLINRRMLRGFEGFHMELTKYWEEVEVGERERRLQFMAKDNLRNARRDSFSTSVREKPEEDTASKQRGIEKSDDSSSSNDSSNLLIDQKSEEISGQVTSSMSHGGHQEAETFLDTKEETSPLETSVIASLNHELAAPVESPSKPLSEAAYQTSDLSSVLSPAVLETSDEEIKTAPSAVNDSPASEPKFEDPAVVGKGVDLGGISSRLDEATKELADIRSELIGHVRLNGIDDSHTTDPTIAMTSETVSEKQDSVAAENFIDLERISARLDEASKAILDLPSTSVPEVDEISTSAVEESPRISEVTEPLSAVSAADSRPDEASKATLDLPSTSVPEVDGIPTFAVEESPTMISEMTEPLSAVSAGDGRLENISNRLDDVSKTSSDLRAELTPLLSDSKDTHTTSNPIETSVETTSAPTSSKSVD
jgi:hypothetical protein